MNWKDLGGQLIRAGAPIIGTALGGPVGGVIGSGLGTILANALGVEDTPESVGKAIETMPPAELQAKLATAESEAAAKWPALAEIAKSADESRVEQSKIINETQRAEIAAGVSPWHWRHLIGYAALLWFLIPIPAFAMLTFRYDGGAVTQLTLLLQAAVPIYGFMCGLLGYIAHDTTKLKAVAITGEQQSGIIEKVVSAAKPVVKRK